MGMVLHNIDIIQDKDFTTINNKLMDFSNHTNNMLTIDTGDPLCGKNNLNSS